MSSNSDKNFDINERMNQLRLQDIGCDVIFQICSKSFPAHSVVLMARLEYFRNTLTDMKEKKKICISFDPEITDPNAFNDVLQFIYTSNIIFTTGNIEAICKIAHFLCFDELLKNAESCMISSINMENIALYMNIADSYNFKAIKSGCNKLIVFYHSSRLFRQQLLPSLSYERFQEVLRKLSIQSKAEDLFDICIEWILADQTNRDDKLVELFKIIPLEKLSSKFVREIVLNNTIVLKNNQCLQLLIPLTYRNDSQTQFIEKLYVFGGNDGEQLSSVSRIDSSTREWIELKAEMPRKQSSFAYAEYEGKIYVCGGFDGQKIMNELIMFDTNTHTHWRTLQSMKHCRESCAMAVLNDHLYVAGGWNCTEKHLSVVERYTILNDRWQEVSLMISKRAGLEMVELNGFLYALGGHDGENGLNSVERYDFRTDQWTQIANMNYAYGWFGSAVFADKIYVAGWYGCEVFDSQEDKWYEMTSPTKCEQGKRLTAFDGKLFAIGGTREELKNGLKSVEYYDFEKGVWDKTEDMSVARSYHGIAVVKKQITSSVQNRTQAIQKLLVFGGSDRTELSSVSRFDSLTREWIELSEMQSGLSHFSWTTIDEKIYICGGFNDSTNMNGLIMLDTNTSKWKALKSMKHCRQGCAMAALNGYLYVAGGFDGRNRLSIVERYSISNDKWKKISPMVYKREGLEMVELNGFLYAMGGNDGKRNLNSVERYDVNKNQWTQILNMNNTYGWFGSAVLNGSIHVLGNVSFEVFNPKECKWNKRAPPTKCEDGRRLVVFEEKLYAIGGTAGDPYELKGLKTVEYFDFQTDVWVKTDDMNIGRCYPGVAVVINR